MRAEARKAPHSDISGQKGSQENEVEMIWTRTKARRVLLGHDEMMKFFLKVFLTFFAQALRKSAPDVKRVLG